MAEGLTDRLNDGGADKASQLEARRSKKKENQKGNIGKIYGRI